MTAESAESLTPAQVLPLLRQQLPKLRERYGVRAMWLFGSYHPISCPPVTLIACPVI